MVSGLGTYFYLAFVLVLCYVSNEFYYFSEIIQHHIWVQIFKFLPLRTLLALACRRNISAIYAALIHSEHYIGPLTVSEKRGRNGKNYNF